MEFTAGEVILKGNGKDCSCVKGSNLTTPDWLLSE
jgi:hypothetical protein